MGLTKVQRYCAACDAMFFSLPRFNSHSNPIPNPWLILFPFPWESVHQCRLFQTFAKNVFVRSILVHSARLRLLTITALYKSTYLLTLLTLVLTVPTRLNLSGGYFSRTLSLLLLFCLTSDFTVAVNCFSSPSASAYSFYPRGASNARVLAIIVCLCVCHTPVLYQNGQTYRIT